jgi:4-hydroxy-3-polyprenylbenzoate decarboxylase
MYVVGITGASGVIYGIRLIEELIKAKQRTAAIATKTALQLASDEIFPGESVASIGEVLLRRGLGASSELFIEYDNSDLYAPIASGSFHFDGIIFFFF